MIQFTHQISPDNLAGRNLYSRIENEMLPRNRNVLIFVSAFFEDVRSDPRAYSPYGLDFGSNPRYTYGIEYYNNQWNIIYNNKTAFLVDLRDDQMIDAVKFNVIAFERSTPYVFEHLTDVANISGASTYLPSRVKNPEHIIIVTQKAIDSKPNPHEIAVQYDSVVKRWRLINVDGSCMMKNLKFNILIADMIPTSIKQKTIIHHISDTTRHLTYVNYSKISNSPLKGNPNFSLLTTQHVKCGVVNDHVTCVWHDKPNDNYEYENKQWFIYNTENAPTPIVSESMYNILVLPKI